MLTIALIWASNRQESLALKLFRRLKSFEELKIIPINPNYPEIAGEICRKNLAILPIVPDLAVFMVNPQLTLSFLEVVKEKWIQKIWLQPWTFDDQVIQKAEELWLQIEKEHCMLIAPKETLMKFLKA